MSELNMYRCTPRQVTAFIEDVLYAGLVPYVQSSPGMGKSSIMRNVAKKQKLKLIDLRLSTCAPEDLSGLPRFNEKGFAEFSPFAELFPLEETELPEGYEGWMLFLDEMNAASKSVQAASYKLILDRMTGLHNLNQRCAITAAGNLSTDRAITNPISTAMQSRVVHIEMEINFEEWLYDVAMKEEYDSRIIAFLSQYNSKLFDFRADHNEKTFACPRTWEFMNRLIKDKTVEETKTALYAGTITSGVAVDFVQFTEVYKTLINISDVLADPVNCHIPGDLSARWATVTHLMEKITEQNYTDLCTYANRFPLEFRILFYRFSLVRKPETRDHPAFRSAMVDLARYLNG